MKQFIFAQKPIEKYKAIMLSLILTLLITGCGDSNVTDSGGSEREITTAGRHTQDKGSDTTSINLNLNLRFKSTGISESKMLESNNGYKFNNIIPVSAEVKPGEILDLQELQQTGIFGLYLTADGLFTISNSDGMSFCSKTVLMEKCSFIDLKLRNDENKNIKVTGILAGE